MKEQHAPEEHREIASFNTDNELNRAINEENFNIPGLPHSTVKQLHGASVRDLIQKIENNPNRHSLQRDLQQSQSFNPFSQESKEMNHEVGNVELCELLDMEPKAQCKVCLSYWNVGIVYCTCGHFLRNGTEENKKFVQYTMDLFSIPSYRPHGHRYGKKPGDREYYIAHLLKKKCKKFYLGIHDQFIRDEKFRKNMFDVGRSEEQLETLNCVNYSLFNLKHIAKYVCRTGTSASSTARAGTSCEMVRKRTRSTSSSLLTSFRFPTTTSRKGDPTATATGRRGSRVLHRESAKKEMQEDGILEHSRSFHP